MMLSVVIPTLNAVHTLPEALAALTGASEIVVADGDSDDGTAVMAARLGARVVLAERGRGTQLRHGADLTNGEWLLFVHADTVLQSGWLADVQGFVALPENAGRAAVFRFALDDPSPAARRLEKLVAWRVRVLSLPYGDQGLLIHRDFYRRLGGFHPLPLMEDVEMVRRIGRDRLVVLPSVARTSAERWRRQGWRRRSLRNLGCLALYFLGVPPRVIHRFYT